MSFKSKFNYGKLTHILSKWEGFIQHNVILAQTQIFKPLKFQLNHNQSFKHNFSLSYNHSFTPLKFLYSANIRVSIFHLQALPQPQFQSLQQPARYSQRVFVFQLIHNHNKLPNTTQSFNNLNSANLQ